jgi:hypothetical protein
MRKGFIMPVTNVAQTKLELETIFQSVLEALEIVISQYRYLFIAFPDDVMSDQTFAFCDEMESLKNKIADITQKVDDRIDNVGNVSKFMLDLHNDELEESKDLSHKIINTVDRGWANLGFHPESIDFNKSNDVVDAEQAQHISFFKNKKNELDQFVKDHPEVLN